MQKRLDRPIFSGQSVLIAKTLLSTKKESIDEMVLEERIPWSVFWVRKANINLRIFIKCVEAQGDNE